MRKWARVIIWSVTLLAVAVAVVWGVDYYRKATQPSAIDPCIANLKMIAGAIDTWAVVHRKTTNDIPTWGDIVPEHFSSQPACHQGGTYTLAPIGQKPTCTVPGHSLRR